MGQKEEESNQNLQNIIDALVSRQTKSSPSSEYDGPSDATAAQELIFQETDTDESAADLLLDINDDTPDAPVAYIDDVTNVDDAANVGNIAYIDDVAHVGNVGYITDFTDAADAADADNIAVNFKNADDGSADIAYAATGDDATDTAYSATGDDAADTAYSAIGDDAADTAYSAIGDDAADTVGINAVGDAAVAKGTSYDASTDNPEGRLIFLSRTLSGLVDLFLIALFSGVFLGMADYFTNAAILSSVSVLNFTTLFLMIYFLYSIFFIGTNGQTIGMIMTDLRVISINKTPLVFSQVVRRNAVFLVSLFGLGIGLLTGVISQNCLCLHDRLSQTCVVRTIEKVEI